MNPLHTLISCFLKLNFNIILPPSIRYPNWSLPFRYSVWYVACISHQSYACSTSRPSHSLLFDHPNIWWRVAYRLWSPSSCNLLSLVLKYSPQWNFISWDRITGYLCRFKTYYSPLKLQNEVSTGLFCTEAGLSSYFIQSWHCVTLLSL
jgi:hypothetical protein